MAGTDRFGHMNDLLLYFSFKISYNWTMEDEKLSARRRAYTENRAKGLSRTQSAVMAGFGDDRSNAARLDAEPIVADELNKLRAETADNVGVTKEMVAAGLIDAAALAKLLADPTGMVAAWRELGKLLGHYAPEVKRIQKSITKGDLRRALEDLSDEDLLKLSQGRVIEGKYTRVDEPKPEAPAGVPLLPQT